MEGPTRREEEDEASPAVEQKQSLKLSRKLARMDSALVELRSLHRLHSAWVDAGFTTNVVGGCDQRVAQSAGQENDDEERNLLEADEDDGGWKFAPSRSSWATGEEDGCDAAAAATSPSTSYLNSHHAASPSLLSTSGALVSPSMPRLACEDEEGVELELDDDEEEGVPIPNHHHGKAQGAASLASAMSSPGGSTGSSPPSSSPSPSSREISGEKSPASQRRLVALLPTKSKSLITSGTRISLSTSFRLPRRQALLPAPSRHARPPVQMKSRR
jgi:hypothetical protein